MLHLTFIAILMLSLINTAHAHYVWLERDGEGSAYAYFGEWVDDIREKAGGLLDRIKAPRAFLGANTTPLPIKRHDDKLEITASGKGDIRLVENAVPLRDDNEKGGITRTIYYAKAGRSETAAKLDLELVPTAAEGSTLVLLFYGVPLAKTEVTLIGPLHYLMLAIRSEYRTNPKAVEEHIARALHWWKAASGDQCWNSPAMQEGSANKDQ